MLPSAGRTASASQQWLDFGAEPSRPASLLCTLRTHQSPGEWQHSLPACSLALAGRDFHPLDFFKWFPPPSLLVPPPPRFSQRDRSPSEKSSTVHLKTNRKVCEFVSHGQDLQN